MIRINLLPPKKGKRAKRRGRRPAPAAAVSRDRLILLAFIPILVGALIGSAVFLVLNSSKNRLEQEKLVLLDDINRLKPKVEKAKEEYEKLVKKGRKLEEIMNPSHRVLWTRKFDLMLDLLPENVWLTNIEISEKKRREQIIEKRKPGEKREPGPPKFRTITERTLVIEGVTTRGRVELIGELIHELKNSPKFMNTFDGTPIFEDVDFVSATLEEVSGMYVLKFTLNLKMHDLEAKKTGQQAQKPA